MLNEDYREMLQSLVAENVKFLLVGAYAMAAHGYPRATMDIDIWVMPSTANARSVLKAIQRFGAPLERITAADLEKEGTVFQIGVAPRRIDLITAATGLRFEEAYARSVEIEVEGLPIRIPSLDDLIVNKRASRRTRDLADAEVLESLRDAESSDPGSE